MSVGIELSTDQTQVVEKKTRQFIENIPHIENEVAERFAEDLEEAVKESVRSKFGRFTGELHDNVDAHRAGHSSTGGAKWEVTANAYSPSGVNYAAWHEYAESGHWVPFDYKGSSNQPIKQWAKQKGIYGQARGVHVTPVNQREGSFMAPAVKKAIKKARRRMRSNRSAPSTGLQQAFR